MQSNALRCAVELRRYRASVHSKFIGAFAAKPALHPGCAVERSGNMVRDKAVLITADRADAWQPVAADAASRRR